MPAVLRPVCSYKKLFRLLQIFGNQGDLAETRRGRRKSRLWSYAYSFRHSSICANRCRMALRTAALSPFLPGLLEFGISQVLGLGVFPATATERALLASMLVKIKIADHWLLVRENNIRTFAKPEVKW
jgi:hypothetical protein